MPERRKKLKPIFRFAHPFFTTAPPKERSIIPGIGQRLSDYIKGTLHPVPKTRGSGRIALSSIVGSKGSQEIEKEGSIIFHAVGDTGKRPDSPEQMVSDAMSMDYDIKNPGKSPAFFLHLGDVIYGSNKDQAYRREFYEPYMHYPGKIIAIPGNHDGEIFPKTDPVSLRAFLLNFCAMKSKVPPIAGSIYRETMTLPGVYWLLETPFIDIIGLDSNSAENPGFISGKIPGNAQKQWLIANLRYIKTSRHGKSRKGLIITTHHPPFSQGGHSGSTEMLADIDDACKQEGIYPDVFLSGHAHSYQRYARKMIVDGVEREILFIVAGTGGVGEQGVPDANGQIVGDAAFVKSYKGYGFLLVTAKAGSIAAEYFAVNVNDSSRTRIDSVQVGLI